MQANYPLSTATNWPLWLSETAWGSIDGGPIVVSVCRSMLQQSSLVSISSGSSHLAFSNGNSGTSSCRLAYHYSKASRLTSHLVHLSQRLRNREAVKAEDPMAEGQSRTCLEEERNAEALAQDAVVWASQHGLVCIRLNTFLCILVLWACFILWISSNRMCIAQVFLKHIWAQIQSNLLQVVGLGSEETPVAVVHAPLTTRPSHFPRASFNKAKRAATVFNTLIDRVSRDSSYLQKTLAMAAEYDDFTVSYFPCRLMFDL